MTFDYGFRRRGMIKQAMVPLLVVLIGVIQAILYYSTYRPRLGYTDYGDVLIMFTISGIVLFLIVIFQRSIEKPSARIPLQVGWMIVFTSTVHSGLINLVDLVYPYSENLLSFLIQSYQDSLALILGTGVVISVVGIYNWIADIAIREQRFYSIVEAMPVGVAVLDAKGRVVLFNRGLSHILHLEADQLQNALMSDLLMIDLAHILETDRSDSAVPVEIDVSLERDDGSKAYLTASFVGHRNKDGRISGHIVVVSDVTQRRRTAEEREQQRRVIDLYASLLSHDIGNDLQAVLGYVEGSLLLLNTDGPKAAEMLESAQAAALRMANLIKTFRKELAPSHIEIVPMLREVSSQAEQVSRGMKVTIQEESGSRNLRSPGGSLLPIAMDNLLRNASEHGGSDVEVNIHVLVEDTSLVIVVSDNGPGIPEEKIRSLFNRSHPDSESGLGLYLTKQIVTACGGTIILDEKGASGGASFRITLPLAE
ncbi:MAG: ATP-binding protein [Candidatus Thorarchaeota archaeon]